MAKAVILSICLLMILSCVEACYIPGTLDLPVPATIPVGYIVTTVEVADCDTKSLHLIVNDPDFTIQSNGDLVAVTSVYVRADGRTFSVVAQDITGSQSEMEIHLYHSSVQKRNENLLRRTKRRWSPPPFNILENDRGPFPKEIEKIVSDSSAKYDVYYTIRGPGYDMNPVGVFQLDRDTGALFLNKPVDREQYPMFVLTTSVFDKNTNRQTDLDLDIRIIVDDVNDNAPEFQGSMVLSVPEESSPGTVVGKINATDKDQEGSDHVAIRYTLLSGTDLFTIDPLTGVITTVSSNLDRETQDKHLVKVQIKDMKGASTGLSYTGTATITLSDINDNPPTFTKPSYTATVSENVAEKLILRIPVEDKDLINTPNWITKFAITKGNENGNFRLDTDPKTNEGLLYVAKPLDYEKTPNVKLELMCRNEADLKGTTAQWMTVPVDVTVTNVDEGPEFMPPNKYLTVKENTPNGTVIGTYTALDPETKTSNGITYYKLRDPASWINVDRVTGELKVANTIDRESSFVQNGIYNITVRAVDSSSKSGTGTVIIQVEDENDNIPKLPTDELLLCEKEGVLGSVVLVAVDKDASPFSAPFMFTLPTNNKGEWTVTKTNDTAAILAQAKPLYTGMHEVDVEVKDLQGFGQVQTVKVRICKCVNGVCPAKKSSVTFGGLGVLAMLLPLLLLLLLGLLLALLCVTKHEKVQMDDIADSGGVLLKSNTEAPGEEVDSTLLTFPTAGVDSGVMGSIKGSVVNAGLVGIKRPGTIGAHENGIYNTNISTSDTRYYDNQFGIYGEGHLLGSGVDFDGRHIMQDSSLLHTWQTNGRYLDQKLYYMGTEEEGRYADDIVHSYGFEGVGSVAGSVGCCSNFGEESLDFLDKLGPKFKTLADVCSKR